MIEIVKNQLDVGLVSEDPAVVDFWRDEAGLVFDHALPVVKGQVQYRFDERGTVVKVNVRKALTGDQRSGIQALLIARDDLDAPREKADPDGNCVLFVPLQQHQPLSDPGYLTTRVPPPAIKYVQETRQSHVSLPQSTVDPQLSIPAHGALLPSTLMR